LLLLSLFYFIYDFIIIIIVLLLFLYFIIIIIILLLLLFYLISIIVLLLLFHFILLLFLLSVRYFRAMIMCSSWFVYCLVVQDCVLGIILCFDGFMWVYHDSPRCIKTRILLCFMYDHVILCTRVQLNDMKVYLLVMDACFAWIECLV